MKLHLTLLPLVALLCLCLLLTGCGQEDPEPAPDPILSLDDIPEDDGLGGDAPSGGASADLSAYSGTYFCTTPGGEWDELGIWDDGSWTLSNAAASLTGWLEYDAEYDAVYAYNDADGSGCPIDITDDGVYLASYGYFSLEASDDWTMDAQNEDAAGYDTWEPDETDGWTEADYHVDVSEFEGTWYCNGDYAADRYLVIDEFGDWTYYSRASGDAEATALDCGFLSPAEGEISTYYADSYWYDNVRYRVFEFDAGILNWDDEGSFELLRDSFD